MDPKAKIPTLVASTADTYCCPIAESRSRERALQDFQSQQNSPVITSNAVMGEEESNYFKSAQW